VEEDSKKELRNLLVKFPKPEKESIFYEDKKVYACLAFRPVTDGHSIVSWKANVTDLNQLKLEEYQYLMTIIFQVRQALLKTYNTDKVYLTYIDESRHVHWHLFPRKKGDIEEFELMVQPLKELTDFSMIPTLRSLLNSYW